MRISPQLTILQTTSVKTEESFEGTNFNFAGKGEHKAYLNYPGKVCILEAVATLTYI